MCPCRSHVHIKLNVFDSTPSPSCIAELPIGCLCVYCVHICIYVVHTVHTHLLVLSLCWMVLQLQKLYKFGTISHFIYKVNVHKNGCIQHHPVLTPHPAPSVMEDDNMYYLCTYVLLVAADDDFKLKLSLQ